jgi:16S rRNA (uracil1498-N3)-methyltransferase
MTMLRAKVRLFVDHPLGEGHDVTISASQAHYLGRVMRLAAGEVVRLFNGRDGEWLARIEQIGKSSCVLRASALLRGQLPEPGPWLCFAPIKKDRMQMMIEKATELGVERLVPVITRHTVAGSINVERMAAQALEAAEQCGRLTLPEVVAEVTTLERLVSQWPAEKRLLVMDERGGQPIVEAVTAASDDDDRPATCALAPSILIGPEGGWADSDMAMLAAKPFVVHVSLGPRILRAETAAVAALACCQALCGDWRTERPPDSGDRSREQKRV